MNIYENESRSVKQFFRCPLQDLHLVGGDAKGGIVGVYPSRHLTQRHPYDRLHLTCLQGHFRGVNITHQHIDIAHLMILKRLAVKGLMMEKTALTA